MPRKRSKKGYAQLASDDLDDVAAQYGAADHIPVPKALHEFDPKMAKRLRRRDLVKKVRSKCEAILWLGGCIWLLHYLDFVHVVLESSKVDRLWFNMGIIAFMGNVGIFIYLAFWLPYIMHVEEEWEDYCPRVIPTATLIGLFSTLCIIIGLWPIYGILTLPILFVFFMGFIMSAHFMPSF